MVSAAIAGCGSSLEEEDTRTLLGELDRAIADAEALDAQRRDGVGALARAAEPPATTSCERSVVLSSRGHTPDAFFILDAENGNLQVLGVGDLTGEGPRMREVRRRADIVRGRLSGGGEPYGADELPSVRAQLAELRDGSRWYRHEIQLVTIEARDPRVVGEGTFEGGFRRGRIVVWDHESHASACAAEVLVHSEEEEDVLRGDDRGMDRGLAVNLDLTYRERALTAIGLR